MTYQPLTVIIPAPPENCSFLAPVPEDEADISSQLAEFKDINRTYQAISNILELRLNKMDLRMKKLELALIHARQRALMSSNDQQP